MREQTASYVTIGGLICLSAVVALAAKTLYSLDGKLAHIITAKPDKRPPMTLTTVVVVSETITTTVTTRQGVLDPKETAAQCVARHNANIQAVVDAGG